jgi:hypothetical protein
MQARHSRVHLPELEIKFRLGQSRRGLRMVWAWLRFPRL